MTRFWCFLFGHVLTEWARVTWVDSTSSEVVTWNWSSNAAQESRFCLRCHAGYEQRWAA